MALKFWNTQVGGGDGRSRAGSGAPQGGKADLGAQCRELEILMPIRGQENCFGKHRVTGHSGAQRGGKGDRSFQWYHSQPRGSARSQVTAIPKCINNESTF